MFSHTAAGKGLRAKTKIRQRLARSKRRIQRRLDQRNLQGFERPLFTASNVHFEISQRERGIAHGGIGLIHALARRTGLIDAIDRHVAVLKLHLPYHESDHVLNLAYNALCAGAGLEDIELRRNDGACHDRLGARRIPAPTTAGDFCRRLGAADIRALQDAFHEARQKVWAEQPAAFFEEAIIDMDGTPVGTTGACKPGMDIAYEGTWGYHPLLFSPADTREGLSLANSSLTLPSHQRAPAE